MTAQLSIVFVGLSITSSWGNGHATTYRGLLRELAARGHDVLFLERDVPYYADNRDMPAPPFGRTALYGSLDELRDRFSGDVRAADLVVVGSYVPEGISVGQWVTDLAAGRSAFYDIDTPITLATVDAGSCAYLSGSLIPRYDLYLSFTGGPTLATLERRYGARRARPLYCSVDPAIYAPLELPPRWDLGYLGTYSEDRQPALEQLMLEPARQWSEGRFSVAGPQYPGHVRFPANVERTTHLPPTEHRAFYNQQRFTLSITRREMLVAGYSPSVRLFEAAACGVPIITDRWPGLESFFAPGTEILTTSSAEETCFHLRQTSEAERRRLASRARARVLAEHTAAHRAESLERYAAELPLGAARKANSSAAGRA